MGKGDWRRDPWNSADPGPARPIPEGGRIPAARTGAAGRGHWCGLELFQRRMEFPGIPGMGRAAPRPLLGRGNVAIPCFAFSTKSGKSHVFNTKTRVAFPGKPPRCVPAFQGSGMFSHPAEGGKKGIISLPVPQPRPSKTGNRGFFLESFIPNPASRPAPSSRPPGIPRPLPNPAWDSFSRREFPLSLISRTVPALFFYSRSDSSSVFETRAWCYPGAGNSSSSSSSSSGAPKPHPGQGSRPSRPLSAGESRGM